MWETESADEDVRVNEGLYLSTSSVDVGAATLFGRPRESRFSSSNSSFVQWRQSPPVVKKWIVDRDCGIWCVSYRTVWVNNRYKRRTRANIHVM